MRFLIRLLSPCLLLSLFIRTAAADPQSIKPSGLNPDSLDLNEFATLEFKILDDPDALSKQVAGKLTSIDPEKEPIPWLRAIWILAWVGNSEMTPELTEKVTKATEMAWKFNLPLEWCQLKVAVVRAESYRINSSDQIQILMDKVIQQARQMDNELAVGCALAESASYLLNFKILEPTMTFLKEANDILKRHSKEKASLAYFDVVSNPLSLALRYQGQRENAIAQQLGIEARYRELGIRSVRALNLYNLGLVLGDRAQEGQARHEGLPYFAEALRLATEINARDYMGMALYGLSQGNSQIGQPEAAIRYAQEALQIFKESNSVEWVPRVLLRLAEAQLEHGEFRAALDTLGQARPEDLEAGLYIQTLAEDTRYRAWLGLGDTAKALNHLQSYVRAYKEIARQKEKEEYNRAAVNLGLQMEAERNSALARQNEMQSEQISTLRKFRVVSILTASLTLLVVVVLYVVRRQAIEIQRSRQRMEEVLDNIDEGIVMIDRNLMILSGHSSRLGRIFRHEGGPLAGTAIETLLFPDSGAAECIMMKAALNACIGENLITWQVNSTHLPSELNCNGRLLQLHWQALVGSHETIHSFLISIRDVTEDRLAAKAMKSQSERLTRLQEKLHEVLSQDIGAVRHLIDQIAGEFAAIEVLLFQNVDVAKAFQRLHSWKGAARTMGLKHLAAHIHALESCLDIHANQCKDLKAAREQWQVVKVEYEEYSNLLANMLSKHGSDDQPKDLFHFAAVYTAELQSRLMEHGLVCRGLTVSDSVRVWQPEALAGIHELLLHALANSIDHGFIRPAQKQRTVRPAWIQIESSRHGDDVVITSRDNGAGIDWERLKAKAKELGIVPQADQSSTDLLFRDGLSTADSGTETSGRGVGLGAIKSIAGRFDGTVDFEDDLGGGSVLSVRFPAARVVLNQGNESAGSTLQRPPLRPRIKRMVSS